MDSADTSFGFTDMTTAVLRELRGERRGANLGPGAADHFVASADGGSAFSHHLRRLPEAYSATGPRADSIGRDVGPENGPDIYSNRQAPGIVRRTFEASAQKVGATTDSARGLQEEPKSK